MKIRKILKKCNFICVILIMNCLVFLSVSCVFQGDSVRQMRNGRSSVYGFVALGETVESIRESFTTLGGQEISLSQFNCDWDDWLYAFEESDRICLLHTDYDKTNSLIVDAFALYDTDGDMSEWAGNKPVSKETVETYQASNVMSFADYCGHWGMNYSENEYVYFLQQAGFAIYDTMIQGYDSVRIIDLD